MAEKLIIERLVGEYKIRLDSSTVEDKILYAVLTIKKVNLTPKVSYRVVHKSNVIHASDYLFLALKAYNNVTTPRQIVTAPLDPKDKNDTICKSCENNDLCKKYLQNPEDRVVACANYS